MTENSSLSDDRAANTWIDVHIKCTAMYSVCGLSTSTQAEMETHQWLW